MATDRNDDAPERETMYSGEMGRRNRSTPGMTPGELGLDPEEMRGHAAIGQSSPNIGGASPDATRGIRTSPAETPGVETLGTGGLSQSGGAAGGDRGHGGASDSGAGGPEGESRGGPGEYKSTSRMDLDTGAS